MTAQRGGTPIIAIQRGTTPILFIQRGSTQVWALGGAFDDFERADGGLGENWTCIDTSPDNKLQIEDGRCRLHIPDGTVGGFWDFRASWFRWNKSPAPTDNGYVECRPATIGDSASLTGAAGFTSDVWGRGNNTGTLPTNGVGIRMMGGHVWIARMISGSGVAIADGGTFQPGNVIRLVYTGSTGTLWVAGQQRVTASLAGVTVNAANRSLIIRGDGCKDFLGPRRYSPAFDYVKMG